MRPKKKKKKQTNDDDIEGFHLIEYLLCVSHYVKLFTYKSCFNNPCQSYDVTFVNEDTRDSES